ncbi:LolA family protein [Evansella cellulosilytica]|uniref:MucB/RseB N-terminal domain-containing protein n=1 Tax=Evansella cellulosilytica (strain ATCC 21833 / DSM 2522 / FERM P-1141 / JCM 9156 / N-4) TaxID=649639 RepID=E6TU88_EVAC2|nr:hypothetical protein [Evansella cellulosilytica]ADU28548.1 hypothetical protein Bcell_0261 [Evansella cellulosilytica DSM 2522]
MKNMTLLIGLITIALIGAGCTSSQVGVSADELYSNILSTNDDFFAYYAEGEMTFHYGDGLSEKATFKEHVSQEGKRKVITIDNATNQQSIAVNDGFDLYFYEEANDTAIKIDLSDEAIPTLTHREQVTSMLENMKDTHYYEVKGEVVVNGIDTYHMVLTAKESNLLIGDIELWVDKKTWFMVKGISVAGDITTTIEYKEIDFSPQFDDDTFTIDLPSHITFTEVNDTLNESIKIIDSISDAEEIVQTPFYLFDEEDLSLLSIESYSLSGEIQEEVTLYYWKNDIPYLSLSVAPTYNEDAYLGGEKVTIRGSIVAEYLESLRYLIWDENNIQYSISILHPDVELDDIIQLVNEMKLSND